nr:MAG TPA: TMPK monophosphate kinase [Inoviridae sp.]
MIYLYSGTPGSGKSCHQAENIIFGLIGCIW